MFGSLKAYCELWCGYLNDDMIEKLSKLLKTLPTYYKVLYFLISILSMIDGKIKITTSIVKLHGPQQKIL